MPATVEKENKIREVKFDKMAAMNVDLERDDMAIAAYGEGRVPYVLLTSNNFSMDTNSRQQVSFERVTFDSFEGYRVWCCEIEGGEMRVCLVR
jgi:hypothetical protein